MLVGLESNSAVLWKIFSDIITRNTVIRFDDARSDAKALYNFHERIITALRPALKEGIKSIVLVSTQKKLGKSFTSHIQLHHSWLTQGSSKVSFSEIVGSAVSLANVTTLVKNPKFHQMLNEALLNETEVLIELLEKRLNTSSRDPLVVYSLEEIEDLIFDYWKPGKRKPDFLLLTDIYFNSFHPKSRLNRLLQIATNKKVKVKTIDIKSPTGTRIAQLGGIALLAERT